MKKITYKIQVIALVIWLIAVIFIFRVIQDRQVASLIAGAGFLILPAFFLARELATTSDKKHISVLIVFLFGAAVPGFLLRITNWGVEFSTLDILGLSAGTLHGFSNVLYLILLGSTTYRWYKTRR